MPTIERAGEGNANCSFVQESSLLIWKELLLVFGGTFQQIPLLEGICALNLNDRITLLSRRRHHFSLKSIQTCSRCLFPYKGWYYTRKNFEATNRFFSYPFRLFHFSPSSLLSRFTWYKLPSFPSLLAPQPRITGWLLRNERNLQYYFFWLFDIFAKKIKDGFYPD